MAFFTEKVPNKTHKQTKTKGTVRDRVLGFCPQAQTRNPHRPERTSSQRPGQIRRLAQEGSSSWLTVFFESFHSLLSPARPPSPCFKGGGQTEEQRSRSSWFLQIPGLHSETLQWFPLALEKTRRPETPSSLLSPAPQSRLCTLATLAFLQLQEFSPPALPTAWKSSHIPWLTPFHPSHLIVFREVFSYIPLFLSSDPIPMLYVLLEPCFFPLEH